MENTDIAVQPTRSVIQDMANKFNMERSAFEATIKKTVMPSKVEVSNEEFVAFLSVANEYNLNPLTKEIYAFPAKGGGIQPIVSVDGWAKIINQNEKLNGIEFHDIREGKSVIAIECKIFRKDREKPTTVIEYMSECKRNTEPWSKWPIRMLRHKALIQCARYAFGYSGIYEEDEIARMQDVTPRDNRDLQEAFKKNAESSPTKEITQTSILDEIINEEVKQEEVISEQQQNKE